MNKRGRRWRQWDCPWIDRDHDCVKPFYRLAESCITGKAEILKPAPPIGTSVKGTVGPEAATGPSGDNPQSPYRTTVQAGICFSRTSISMGAAVLVKGLLSAGQALRVIIKPIFQPEPYLPWNSVFNTSP